jgi:hypothetical protein
MSTEDFDKQFMEWARQSERLFGEPAEVDSAEAEELLRTAGIDPDRLKSTLHQKMLERSKKYTDAGKPLPPLLQQALEDLKPAAEQRSGETASLQAARLSIARLLRDISELPVRLGAGLVPVFTAAYRNRTELSAHDKKILDEIGENLRKKAQE